MIKLCHKHYFFIFIIRTQDVLVKGRKDPSISTIDYDWNLKMVRKKIIGKSGRKEKKIRKEK